mmetsp:Transcript_51455/g.117054  ORF Transcript_51455/g.117054 Transcript_51455/m.117054 type:complete len:897 (-) Transcript_51455:171-2861(-)
MAARLGVQKPLVAVHQLGGLIGVLQREGLEVGRLHLVQHHGLGGLVPGRVQLVVDHHLGNDALGHALLQVEHAAELVERQGVVVDRVGEEVSAQSLRLDLGAHHLLDPRRHALARDEVPHVEVVQDERRALLPVARHERLGRHQHMVPRVLRRPAEHLPMHEVHVLPEVARDVPRPVRSLLGGHIGHLEEHRADEVARLKQVLVDVHVVWGLPPTLRLFLLGVFVAVAHGLHPLGQQLLDPRGADLHQAGVRVPDQPLAEGAEAQEDHGAVEEDLGGHVGVGDGLLQVAHQQEVARLVEAVVQRVVGDVAQHGPRARPRVPVHVDEPRADALEESRHVLRLERHRGLARGRGRVRLGRVGTRGLGAEAARVQRLVLAELVLEGLRLGHAVRDAVVLVVHVLDGHERRRRRRLEVAGPLVVAGDPFGEAHELVLEAEPLHVLLGVGVDLLQRLGVLLVQPRHQAVEAAHDAHHRTALLGLALGLVALLGLDLALPGEDHVSDVVGRHRAEGEGGVRLEHLHGPREVLVALAPVSEGEEVVHVAHRVQVGRHQVEQHRHLHVGPEPTRRQRKLRQVPDHLARVDATAAALGHDLHHLLVELGLGDVHGDLEGGLARGHRLLLLWDLGLARGHHPLHLLLHLDCVHLEPLGATREPRVRAPLLIARAVRVRVTVPLIAVGVASLGLLGLGLGLGLGVRVVAVRVAVRVARVAAARRGGRAVVVTVPVAIGAAATLLGALIGLIIRYNRLLAVLLEPVFKRLVVLPQIELHAVQGAAVGLAHLLLALLILERHLQKVLKFDEDTNVEVGNAPFFLDERVLLGDLDLEFVEGLLDSSPVVVLDGVANAAHIGLHGYPCLVFGADNLPVFLLRIRIRIHGPSVPFGRRFALVPNLFLVVGRA